MKGFRTLGFNIGALASAPWVGDLLTQLGFIPAGQEVTAAVVTMALANGALRLVTNGPVGANAGGFAARWITNTVLKELARRRAAKVTQEKS